MYGLLTKLVLSRWLDIGLVLFLRVHKHAKKERGQYQAILTEQKVGQYRIYYMAFGEIFRAGSPERAR